MIPRIVFEDEWLLAVDKPGGLLAVPGRIVADSVVMRLRAVYPDVSEAHRLDLDTSGLMLLAKDRATQRALHRGFAERAVEKLYLAELDGIVAADAGEVRLPLRLDVDARPRQIVDWVQGREAITAWRVIGRDAGRTRVELTPLTGKTHQLRVHAAHPEGIGTPIVGDRLYGRAGEQMLLHATRLAFSHPHTGARIQIEARPSF